MAKLLMKGNEAIAEAAVAAGCMHYFGYPITPSSQIPEYMAKRLPPIGGVFMQSESEVSAINMVYGASGAGVRTMTASSSPGISLKQEGISYIACAELPCLIVNIMRGGPGLGSIQPSQSDYFQATRGGGHGDYYMPVYAPASVQEAVELTQKSFDIADKYRTPVMLVTDGVLGQMMEPVEINTPDNTQPVNKDWAATGWDGHSRERSIITSLFIESAQLEQQNNKLLQKYAEIQKNETLWEEINTDDAEIIIVAYGTVARVVQSAMRQLRQKGIKCGMLRPITLWPFPEAALAALSQREHVKKFLTIELSAGQMLFDVKLAVLGRKPVEFYGRTGGVLMSVEEIIDKVQQHMQED